MAGRVGASRLEAAPYLRVRSSECGLLEPIGRPGPPEKYFAEDKKKEKIQRKCAKWTGESLCSQLSYSSLLCPTLLYSFFMNVFQGGEWLSM